MVRWSEELFFLFADHPENHAKTVGRWSKDLFFLEIFAKTTTVLLLRLKNMVTLPLVSERCQIQKAWNKYLIHQQPSPSKQIDLRLEIGLLKKRALLNKRGAQTLFYYFAYQQNYISCRMSNIAFFIISKNIANAMFNYQKICKQCDVRLSRSWFCKKL